MTWLWILIPAAVLLLLVSGGKRNTEEQRKNEPSHWIYHPHVLEKDDYECSRCHARFRQESPVCSRCGARMTGKTVKNEEEWLAGEEELDLLLEDD